MILETPGYPFVLQNTHKPIGLMGICHVGSCLDEVLIDNYTNIVKLGSISNIMEGKYSNMTKFNYVIF